MPYAQEYTLRGKEIPTLGDFLSGHTLKAVRGMEKGSDEIWLDREDGHSVRLWHEQDCCESVSVDDVCGDPGWLVGSPVVLAEEVSNGPMPEGYEPSKYDSETWTFYRFATQDGLVTVRWYGTSNGYYSESVSFDLYDLNAGA